MPNNLEETIHALQVAKLCIEDQIKRLKKEMRDANQKELELNDLCGGCERDRKYCRCA